MAAYYNVYIELPYMPIIMAREGPLYLTVIMASERPKWLLIIMYI
jgi:hypothetical protein